MTEQVKVLQRTPAAVLIWNAMCEGWKPEEYFTRFPGLKPEGPDTEVTVQLLVNGVEVPVVKVLEAAWKRADEQCTQNARDMAAEALRGSPLQALIDRLQSVRWEVDNELDKLFPGTRGES